MKKKYNIAYLPLTQRNKLIELANKFSHLSAGYLLGERSIPHLTVCQFLADQRKIDLIWYEVNEAIKEKVIALSFSEFSYLYIHEVYWIALRPEVKEQLFAVRKIVEGIIQNPLGRRPEGYDPHLTLINTRDANCGELIGEVAKEYGQIKDKFVLVLGECDNLGQVTRLLKTE